MTTIEVNTLLLHTIVSALVLVISLGWYLYLREKAKPNSLNSIDTDFFVALFAFFFGIGILVSTLFLVTFVIEAFLRGTRVIQ